MMKYAVERLYKEMYEFIANWNAVVAVKSVYKTVMELIFELFCKNYCFCFQFNHLNFILPLDQVCINTVYYKKEVKLYKNKDVFKMNNAEFSKNFVFTKYKLTNFSHTDNSKNAGAPANFIALMLSGSGVLKSRTSTINVQAGDVFFIQKNELYRSWWYGDETNPVEFLSLGSQNLPIGNNVRFTLQKISCAEQSKKMLYDILNNLTVNCKTVGLFYSFLGDVIQGMERKVSHHQLIIEKALDYMYSNDSCPTSDIADYCGVSEATIYNIFSKTLNKTPNILRQQILCEKAVKLLTTTTLSVEEISSHLQFSSSSYFRKILKKHLNKTPSQIRKESFM